MVKLNETELLKNKIILLQEKKSLELKLMKQYASSMVEAITLQNLIKHAWQEVTNKSTGVNILVNGVIGFAGSYFSKNLFKIKAVNTTMNTLNTLYNLVLPLLQRHKKQ